MNLSQTNRHARAHATLIKIQSAFPAALDMRGGGRRIHDAARGINVEVTVRHEMHGTNEPFTRRVKDTARSCKKMASANHITSFINKLHLFEDARFLAKHVFSWVPVGVWNCLPTPCNPPIDISTSANCDCSKWARALLRLCAVGTGEASGGLFVSGPPPTARCRIMPLTTPFPAAAAVELITGAASNQTMS